MKTTKQPEVKAKSKLGYAKRMSNDVVVRGGCTSTSTTACGMGHRMG